MLAGSSTWARLVIYANVWSPWYALVPPQLYNPEARYDFCVGQTSMQGRDLTYPWNGLHSYLNFVSSNVFL